MRKIEFITVDSGDKTPTVFVCRDGKFRQYDLKVDSSGRLDRVLSKYVPHVSIRSWGILVSYDFRSQNSH